MDYKSAPTRKSKAEDLHKPGGLFLTGRSRETTPCREPSVEELQKLSKIYNVTVDELINPQETTPKEIVIADKTATEQMRLIQELDEEDKQTIFRLIDKMLTNKKFKDFFQKNIATM